MSSASRYEAAFESLKQSHAAGRLAHAYIVVAPARTTGLHFVESFITHLFAEGAEDTSEILEQVTGRTHPDIHWAEPQSKSRKILTDQIRDLNHRIAHTSYHGSWKAGVLLNADRLTPGAANAFLKTLEEPPPRSIFFLVTAEPQNFLPTIISRCQRILLSDQAEELSEPWLSATQKLLEEGLPIEPIEALSGAGKYKALLDEVVKAVTAEEKKADNEDETQRDKDVYEARLAARVREVRSQILCMMVLWRRDVLIMRYGADGSHLHFPEKVDIIQEQAAQLTPAGALNRVHTVEQMARQLDRNLPNLNVFEAGQLQSLGLRKARSAD